MIGYTPTNGYRPTDSDTEHDPGSSMTSTGGQKAALESCMFSRIRVLVAAQCLLRAHAIVHDKETNLLDVATMCPIFTIPIPIPTRSLLVCLNTDCITQSPNALVITPLPAELILSQTNYKH